MEISEKVAYLKGLAEGLNLDTESKEGKLIAAIIDVLDDMAEKFADVEDELCDVEDGLDAVSDDLSDVEETLYFALDDDARASAPIAAPSWSSSSAIWPTMRTRIRSNSKNKKEPPRGGSFFAQNGYSQMLYSCVTSCPVTSTSQSI